LLLFRDDNRMRLCQVRAGSLTIIRLAEHVPISHGLAAPPIRLADGRLVAVSSGPRGAEILVIYPRDRIIFENLAEVTGAGRRLGQVALVGENFLVGICGRGSGTNTSLWIFDLQTQRSCFAGQQGTWPSLGRGACFLARGDSLYLFGGQNNRSVYSIPLPSIVPFSDNAELRSSFRVAALEARVATLEAALSTRDPLVLHTSDELESRERLTIPVQVMSITASPPPPNPEVGRGSFKSFKVAVSNPEEADAWDRPSALIDPRLRERALACFPGFPEQNMRVSFLSQVKACMRPGIFLSETLAGRKKGTFPLSRRGEKLLDSARAKRWLTPETIESDGDIDGSTFPAIRETLSEIAGLQDSLRRETWHNCISAVHRADRALRLLDSASRCTGLGEALPLLQRAWDAATGK